jgi:galactonate dehydratase
MNRRECLSTAAAVAAGSAFLAEAVGQEKNPAAQVADKTSTLKITALRTYWVNPVVFVKIETNHGAVGWGEIKAVDPRVAKVLAESLFSLIEGENPTRIEYLWQKVYRAHRDIRGGPFMVHTLAGIDIALWDLAGKLWGEPVYRLLGGPCRDRIRVYHTPKAVKLPPHGIYEHSANPADIDRMVKVVKEAREKVGPDGAVMFDAHCALPPATLIQFANAVRPYDLLFLEEPAVPGNIEVFKRIKQAVNVPLAAGERDRTIWEFIPYLHERCLDVLQPDCCHTGGITQMKKIAVLAEAYQVPIAPHCTASLLGISASLHTACSVPLFLIHEFYPDNMGFNPKGMVKMAYEVDKEGYVTLPPGPGLGVEIDEKAVEEASKKPQTYKWPGAKLKDGSVADY